MAVINVDHYTPWNRPDPPEPRADDRPNPTEQAYMPLRVMMKRFKEAGLRLEDYKKKWYYDQIDDDPTTIPGGYKEAEKEVQI